MIPNKYLTKLLQINFHSSDTFSESKIKLVRCEKLILSTNNVDVINGAFGKLTNLFLTKNKFLKRSCIPIFKRIKNKLSSMDVDILDMLLDSDDDVVKLALRFVNIFSKFYSEDSYVFYIILNSKTKYKFKVIKSILSTSSNFLEYFTQSPKSIIEKYSRELDVEMDFSNISSLENISHLNLPESKHIVDSTVKRTKISQINSSYDRTRGINILVDKEDIVKNLSIVSLDVYNDQLCHLSSPVIQQQRSSSKGLDLFVYALKCLYRNKVEECINTFSLFLQNEDLEYKFRVIFNFFIKLLRNEEEPKQLIFDIKDCHIDESLIIKTNCFYESPVFKKILKAYKNMVKR